MPDNDRRYWPKVHGMLELFDARQTEPESSQITKVGFPERSSILIAGAPGSGKTLFALALVRELLWQDAQASGEAGTVTQLCYVSTAQTKSVLERRYSRFGWFNTSFDPIFRDPQTQEDRVQFVDVSETLLPQPTFGADELINPVFTQLRGLVESCRLVDCYAIVDSLTSLLKDSAGAGDRRRNTHEIIERFGKTLPDRSPRLLLLIAEWPEDQVSGVAPEEHVADFVFRLRVERTGRGRRRRTFEVTKSQGSDVIAGVHSWALITERSLKRVVASRLLQTNLREYHCVKRLHPRPKKDDKPPWCTIALFPAKRLIPVGSRIQGWKPLQGESEQRITTGTPGLDQMLTMNLAYWAQPTTELMGPTSTKLAEGLRRGSTTLIIGKSGTGKTLAALQFLLAARDKEKAARDDEEVAQDMDEITCDKQEKENEEPDDSVSRKRSMYVNFENLPSRVRAVFPDTTQGNELTKCVSLYRRRANMDLNVLLAEIHHAIIYRRIERLAIDGLSDLFTTLSKHECSQLVEDLLVSIRATSLENVRRDKEARERGETPEYEPVEPITIFVTLEIDPEQDPLSGLEHISFAADNLIVFQQVSINDEIRKTAKVIKARGSNPDRQVREAVVRGNMEYPFRIVPGLEIYRELDTKEPKPVRVSLQLVAENKAEESFNKDLTEDLDSLFAYPVKLAGFSRGEIHQTLLDIAAGFTRIPQANVKLLSIDEWWVRELRVIAPQSRDERPVQKEHPLLALEDYLLSRFEPASEKKPDRPNYRTFASEYWITEFEKATSPCLRPSSTGGADSDMREVKAELVACPSYMDFGLFCANKRLLLGAGGNGGRGAVGDLIWTDLLARIPRTWATVTDELWFDSPQQDPQRVRTVVDLLRCECESAAGETIGFAFDMETPSTLACALLEFCWAFGATEDFLIRDLIRYDRPDIDRDDFLKQHPATLAIQFLQFLVVEGLMPKRTTVECARKAILSRHWFSTLRDVQDRKEEVVGQERDIWPLPFFPLAARRLVGMSTRDSACVHALHDCLARFQRLIRRIRAACEYRQGLFTRGEDENAEGYGKTQEEADIDRIRNLARQVKTRLREISAILNEEGSRPDVDDVLRGHLKWMQECDVQIRGLVLNSPAFALGRGVLLEEEPGAWQTTYPNLPDEVEELESLWMRKPAAVGLDVRDTLQLLDWSKFRMSILAAELELRPLAAVVSESYRGGTPRGDKELPVALTGYACEGSWMMAVDRRTYSPRLATRLIQEMNSPPRVEKRAEVGAGIPSRKDFYEYHGREMVRTLPGTGMRWNDLLTYTVARSRRRNRIVCSDVSVSSVLDLLSQRLLHCLTVADECRVEYRNDRDKTIEKLQKVAREATRSAFEHVRHEMKKQHEPCLFCPHPDVCQALKTSATQEAP